MSDFTNENENADDEEIVDDFEETQIEDEVEAVEDEAEEIVEDETDDYRPPSSREYIVVDADGNTKVDGLRPPFGIVLDDGDELVEV